jgi:hypothetical protein
MNIKANDTKRLVNIISDISDSNPKVFPKLLKFQLNDVNFQIQH